jgi:hypothetical protein
MPDGGAGCGEIEELPEPRSILLLHVSIESTSGVAMCDCQPLVAATLPRLDTYSCRTDIGTGLALH